MQQRSNHRRRRPQKQGFSRPGSRQWFDMLGIRRDQKREFFNLMARCVVASCALTGGAMGFVAWGTLGGLIGCVLGAALGARFVGNDRMLR